MSKKTLYILGILLTLLVGTLLYWQYCCKCKKAVSPGAVTENETINNFVLSGDGFNYQCRDNFRFPENGFDFVQPVGDSINVGIKMLKDLFGSSPSQKLVITGYCTSAETNPTSFPDLGFARAKALKDYFVSQGIPDSFIDIHGEMKDGLTIKEGFVCGPADFKLIPAEVKPGPLVLYFKTGQKQILLTPEQQQAILDISKYLEKNPDAKLVITGYTDNVGNRASNERLGLMRANWVRSCFVKNSVPESKIECSSKGPDDPVADNATSEGQAKNRRTVITIK